MNEVILRERLMALATTKEMTPEQLQKVVEIVNTWVGEWREAKVAELNEMVSKWEQTMGDEDKTLYTLGIRRAVDVIREESAFQQLPVLEKPDTPLE